MYLPVTQHPVTARKTEVEHSRINPRLCAELNDGHHIPVLGFGTYAPAEVRIVVLEFRRKRTGLVGAESLTTRIRTIILGSVFTFRFKTETSLFPTGCNRENSVTILTAERLGKGLYMTISVLYLIYFQIFLRNVYSDHILSI